MKTHKNPALKSQSGRDPVRTGPKPFTAPKPSCAVNTAQKLPLRKEPPVLELEGKKWRVVSVCNQQWLIGVWEPFAHMHTSKLASVWSKSCSLDHAAAAMHQPFPGAVSIPSVSSLMLMPEKWKMWNTPCKNTYNSF